MVVDGAAAGDGAPNNDVDGAGAGVVVVDPNSPPPVAVGAGAGVDDPKRPPDGAGADNFIEDKRICCN